MSARLQLVAILFLHVAASIAVGRFTGTDEIAFKAAGREWAESGRFAAPELTGFGGFDSPVEQIWLAHLPVYSFLFGLFVKIAGFGATQSIAFDALIHAVLAALTFALCRRMAPAASPYAALAAAILVLPLGMPGRADELAACFGMAGLLASHPIVAGIFLGIGAATNVVAAGFLGLQKLVAVAAGGRPLRTFAVLAAAGAITAYACLAPIVLAHPDAWRQFTAHAEKQIGLEYAWSLRFAWTYGRHFILVAAAALLIAAAASSKSRVLPRFAGAIAAIVLIVALVPAKYYYFWLVGPLLIAAACATIGERRVPRAAVVLAGAIYAMAIAGPVRQMVIVATLPRAQRLGPNVAAIRRIVPAGSVVLASEFWSSLANDVEYRSLVHGVPDYDRVDFVILTGNGSGMAGRAQTLTPEQAAAIESRFVVVHDNLNRRVPRLFGVPLSHSAWGFGTRILRNRRNPLN